MEKETDKATVKNTKPIESKPPSRKTVYVLVNKNCPVMIDGITINLKAGQKYNVPNSVFKKKGEKYFTQIKK